MASVKNQAFNTSSWPSVSPIISTEQVKKSFGGQIAMMMPNGAAPLFALTSMQKEKSAIAPEHGYFAKVALFPSFTITNLVSGISGNSPHTSIAVSSGSDIVPGMLMRAEAASGITAPYQQHIILVTAVSSNTISFIANIGDSAHLTIAAGTQFYQIGNAMGEASDRPQSILTQAVRISNYTQIFRNTWTISDTVRATQMAAGNDNVSESKREAMMFHARDIEAALIFGRKDNLSTVSGLGDGPVRTMDGILGTLASASSIFIGGKTGADNSQVATSTTTWTQLEGLLEPTLDAKSEDATGVNDRVVFVGPTALKVINNIVRINAQYEIYDDKTPWGLQYRTLKTTRGTFRMIEHPLLGSNATWSKYAIIVDLASISLAYLRKTNHVGFNAKGAEVDDGVDAVGGTLTTECTLELRNPQGCGVISNLTAAAVG